MAIWAVTPPGKRSSTNFRWSSSSITSAWVFLAIALAIFEALPSIVKSRSRMGKPPNISRMAPPARNRLTLASAAAAWTSLTTRF